MTLVISIFLLLFFILTRAFSAASVILLFICMRICFLYMATRSNTQHDMASHNDVIRMANEEKRTASAKKSAEISLSDIMKDL